MTDKDFRELKELILGLEKQVEVGLTQVNTKVEVGLTEINAKVDVGFTEIKGELKRIEQKLDNKFRWLRKTTGKCGVYQSC